MKEREQLEETLGAKAIALMTTSSPSKDRGLSESRRVSGSKDRAIHRALFPIPSHGRDISSVPSRVPCGQPSISWGSSCQKYPFLVSPTDYGYSLRISSPCLTAS